VAIGLGGVAMLDLVRRRIGMRRDYESLYALGIAFTAFAGAEAVHGSGFLAAFAAGLTVAAFDAELCDCFLDYGEATAEVFLLFTFVALGSSLIWEGLKGVTIGVVAFAVIALLARTMVLAVALMRERLDRSSRRLIVWFGPRGLSSLLLVLLAVFAGLPGSERLFAVTALVVLISVLLHGGSLMLVGQAGLGGGSEGTPTAPAPATRRLPIADSAPVAVSPTDAVADRERITLDGLQILEDRGEPVVLLDVRKDRAWNESDVQARGAVRLPPDRARERAAELALPRHAWLVAYCA
jgi:sodium/hydrogen antiporter